MHSLFSGNSLPPEKLLVGLTSYCPLHYALPEDGPISAIWAIIREVGHGTLSNKGDECRLGAWLISLWDDVVADSSLELHAVEVLEPLVDAKQIR